MASRHPLAFAIVRRSAWSIPRFRTDFLRFTSHIVEQSRYLPPRKSCHPTAAYACPGGAAMAWRFIRGVAKSPLCEVGWKSLGVLELTALPSIKKEHWVPLVQEADALLVYGGDVLYLCYWMRQSGLADLLPELGRETVYVGVSAGSMVVTPYFGEAYDDWFCRQPPASHLPKG